MPLDERAPRCYTLATFTVRRKTMSEEFKLTYATMFNPPEELHNRFDEALAKVKSGLGKEYGMLIGGKDRFTVEKFEDRSPANMDVVLGIFQKGGEKAAMDCAAAAA